MSSHYFIGKRLNPYESKKMETSLSYVLRKNSFLPQKDSTKDFMTSFIYLGYLNDQVAYDLLNVLDPYILALAQNTKPIKCTYTHFELSGHKTTHKNFSVSYQSENNLVHNVIMPYLQYAMEDVLEEPHKELLGYEPNINLVKIRTSLLTQFRNQNRILKENDIEVLPNYFVGKPQNRGKEQYFMLDSIDVIKGKPEELKVGTQSQTDRLILDTIRSVPLTGKSNTVNNGNNGNNGNTNKNKQIALIKEYKEENAVYEEQQKNIKNALNKENVANGNNENGNGVNGNTDTTNKSNSNTNININKNRNTNRNTNNDGNVNKNVKKVKKNDSNLNALLNDI